MNITWQKLIECIFSPVPVYKISIDQVQYLLCVFSIFSIWKNNFYIDSMDLVHFEEKN